jgi:ubiquinone/menaquinone biosynthesis C-methylase UbiE
MPDTTADARFWDRKARQYARDPIKDQAGYERTLMRTRQLLRPTDQVLEIGCGTGTTALALAEGVASLVGTDLSAEMIAIAREKALARRCGNVRFAVAAAEDVAGAAFADGGADVVLAFNLLHLVGDQAAVLRQIFRVLKPGGTFISKTPCLREMSPLIRLAVPLMRAIGQAPQVLFFSAGELEQAVEQAGFIITERARHGSGAKDARLFLVARKPE